MEHLNTTAKELFGDNSTLLLGDGCSMLLAHQDTTHGISEKLTEKDVGAFLIVPVTNYNGLQPADVWEWLNLHHSL